MPVINFLGTLLYLRMKPTFRGAKAPVLCTVPFTAENPTDPQKKARAWLIREARANMDTFGRDPSGRMPMIASKIQAKAPGTGAHGGKTPREYVIAKRKSAEYIDALLKKYAV